MAKIKSEYEGVRKIVGMIDGEIEQVVKVVQATDPKDQDYTNLMANLERLVQMKQTFLDTVDQRAVDGRNWMQKLADRIDPTEIAKIMVIGTVVIVVMKHEELEVISGQAFRIISNLLRV